MKTFIWRGNERAEIELHAQPDGSLAGESPFTGKRIVIPFDSPLKRRRYWMASEVYKLECRLEKSRRCPDRPATTQRKNE